MSEGKYAAGKNNWGGYVPSGWDKHSSTGFDDWRWTNRTAIAPGSYLIRPASHSTLLPEGYHPFVKHKVQIDVKDPTKITPVLCTVSYAPEAPCYNCDIIIDLDRGGFFKDNQKSNPKLVSAIMDSSGPAGGFYLVPCLIYGEMTKTMSRDGLKEFDTLVSSSTAILSIVLALDMGRGACVKLFEMLQDMKDLDPTLDNAQFGKWLVYGKEQTSQKLSVAPKELQRPLTKEQLELLSDKKYPKLQSWGASERDPAKDTRRSYSQARQVFKDSWMGQELQSPDYEWDLDNVEKVSHTLRQGYQG